MGKINNFFSKDKIKRLCMGLLASAAVTALMLLLFAFVAAKGAIKLSMLGVFSGAAAALGGFIGGMICGSLIKEKGIICGLINGVLFSLLILSFSVIYSLCFFNLTGIVKLLLIVLFSIIGGIIGVNRKHKEIKY